MRAASSGAVSAPDSRQLVCADSSQKRSSQLVCKMHLAGVRWRVSGHTHTVEVSHAFCTGIGLQLRRRLTLCGKPDVCPLSEQAAEAQDLPTLPLSCTSTLIRKDSPPG